MGWNDRLPEDPYIPYESQDDRDAYDNWAMYMEFLRAEEAAVGLTSNNIQPGDAAANKPAEISKKDVELLDRLSDLLKKYRQTNNETTQS